MQTGARNIIGHQVLQKADPVIAGHLKYAAGVFGLGHGLFLRFILPYNLFSQQSQRPHVRTHFNCHSHAQFRTLPSGHPVVADGGAGRGFDL